MKTHLGHLQINVDPANFGFYQQMFEFLGWQTLHMDEHVAGFMPEDSPTTLWFAAGVAVDGNSYDGVGMNHLAIGAESVADVEKVADFLQQNDIEALFETPRHRPEFSMSEQDTYYQVMFESPDRVLFEVVYTGPK